MVTITADPLDLSFCPAHRPAAWPSTIAVCHRAGGDAWAGSQLVHDDRLISAALIAEVDRLCQPGAITIGRAETALSYRRRIRWPTLNSSDKEWQAGDVAPTVAIAVRR